MTVIISIILIAGIYFSTSNTEEIKNNHKEQTIKNNLPQQTFETIPAKENKVNDINVTEVYDKRSGIMYEKVVN